jgi:predicted acylesterase/phospholipase RssA
MARSAGRTGVWAVWVLLLAGPACVKTNALVDAFNGGLLDTSAGDPDHKPGDFAIELVAARIRQELGDGYFGQGGADRAYVADWMQSAAKSSMTFARDVGVTSCLDDAPVGMLCQRRRQSRPDPVDAPPAAGQSSWTLSDARALLRRHAALWAGEASDVAQPEHACAERGSTAQQRFVDFVRFESALERATRAVAALQTEGLVNSAQIALGARRAFSEAAQYLRDRGWQRARERKTSALVVKGGASTGIFSAGAVWAVLGLINECMHDAECSARQSDFRFELMSGTSTGALVSTAVDLYNSQPDYESRRRELVRFAKWFACSSTRDLYCVQSAPVFDLLREQDALLDFDGLRAQLRQSVTCQQLLNPSELILNTVDFRSGRLLALSDQDRYAIRCGEDVVQGALASAVLPVIARPVRRLPSNPSPNVLQAYVDGGIRSEIPVLPVARRGAERVLVVGSSSSVPGETGALINAGQFAARYIDVSLAGVIESDLAQSQSYVQSVRLSEKDVCLDELAGPSFAALCRSEDGCDPNALCSGRWDEVCAAAPGSAQSTGQDNIGTQRMTQTLAERLDPVWRMVAIFRDERRVEPLHGYTFNPKEQRRLFLAGAETARISCMRIAKLLGLTVPEDETAPLRKKLAAWCAPELAADVCGAPVSDQPPPGLKDCQADEQMAPLPAALTRECRPAVPGAP